MTECDGFPGIILTILAALLLFSHKSDTVIFILITNVVL